jgi:hypothetical protein
MYALSPSKSIKGSNYGKFLKDKNVLLCTRLYKWVMYSFMHKVRKHFMKIGTSLVGGGGLWCSAATFNNISVISWRSVFIVGENPSTQNQSSRSAAYLRFLRYENEQTRMYYQIRVYIYAYILLCKQLSKFGAYLYAVDDNTSCT